MGYYTSDHPTIVTYMKFCDRAARLFQFRVIKVILRHHPTARFSPLFGIKSTECSLVQEPFACVCRSASCLAPELTMSVSAEEVAKHNSDKDCWVIVGDQVLDVTNFLSPWDIMGYLSSCHSSSIFSL